MIEIIVGVWLVSFVLSMTVVGINYHITKQKLSSTKLLTLNSNLSLVGLFWSNSRGDFSELLPHSADDDRKKSLRNVLLMGFLGLWSVPGFLLLAIVVISLHKLARSRKETATFQSALASGPIADPNLITQLVSELKQIH